MNKDYNKIQLMYLGRNSVPSCNIQGDPKRLEHFCTPYNFIKY